MNLLKRYKVAFQELEPYLAVIWIACLIGMGTAFLFFIPLAGFLVMLLNLNKGTKTPDLGDLLIQFDQFVPLVILFILAFAAALGFVLVSIVLMAISGFLCQFFRLVLVFGCGPFLIAGFTYTLLLICDQKIDAISALRQGFMGMQKNPREHFLLGLGTLLLSLPCLLGAPLGFHTLVVQYRQDFTPRSV